MGKPGTRHGVSLRSEHIGPGEGTRGIETSQYPEERKATATPLVAASEEGRGQTVPVPSLVALPVWGSGTRWTGHQTRHGVIKLMRRRSVQERRAVEGNGPVSETYSASVRCSQVAPGP
jgi:hypothetical protein